MVMLAMSAAVVLGGGPLLITEAAVSAILLVLLEPSGSGFRPCGCSRRWPAAASRSRSARSPSHSIRSCWSAARSMTCSGGWAGRWRTSHRRSPSTTRSARSPRSRTPARSTAAMLALDEALVLGHETARFSPGRRSSLGALDRYARSAPHIDLAVADARMLARQVLRFLRNGGTAPESCRGGPRPRADGLDARGRARLSRSARRGRARRLRCGRPHVPPRASTATATSAWPRSWWACARPPSTCCARSEAAQ